MSVYSSGDWYVTAGREGEFLRSWQELLAWVRDTAPGFEGGSLLRDDADPRHFVSFARWRDDDARGAWGRQPEAGARMQACIALCENARPGTYQLEFTV